MEDRKNEISAGEAQSMQEIDSEVKGIESDNKYFSMIAGRENMSLIESLKNGMGEEIRQSTAKKKGWLSRLIDKII